MEAPKFFEGIVAEDPASELGRSADGPQIGRVLVREILGHSNRVSTEDLIPATIMMPSTSAGVGGVGLSPTGLLNGTRVMCMKMGSFTYIMGVINYAPEGNHSVSSYARGQGEPELKARARIKGPEGTTIEPDSKYKAEYPYNNTMTTRSGHLLEFDDTPGAERVHIYHKSGSYIEILPDGTIVTKSVKDHIQLAFGNMLMFNAGEKNKAIEIVSNDGEVTIGAKTDVSIYCEDGNVNILANNGSVSVVSKSGVIDTQAPRIGLNAGDLS